VELTGLVFFSDSVESQNDDFFAPQESYYGQAVPRLHVIHSRMLSGFETENSLIANLPDFDFEESKTILLAFFQQLFGNKEIALLFLFTLINRSHKMADG
jgi:hypothetical protein